MSPPERSLASVSARKVYFPGAPQVMETPSAPIQAATSMARALEQQALTHHQLIDGRWRIEQQIGFGSFGKVYRARDTDSGELVAIKIFNGQLDATGYVQELGLLFNETHPNLVATLAFGYTRGRRHIVYEHISGGNLREQLVRSPRQSQLVALNVVRDVVAGIAFAHSRNIVHRDLKPENILLTRPDWPFEAKVCDFGLSTRFKHETKLHSNYGSPGYMAPEQLSKSYDHRVDYYAIGVILYEMLFGRRPFQGDLVSIRHAHQHLSLVLPEGLPPSLEALLSGLLARDPDERLVDPEAILRLLDRALAEPASELANSTITSTPVQDLTLTPSWCVEAPARLHHYTLTHHGHLVLGLSDRLTLLTRQGKSMDLVQLMAPVEGFIEGGKIKGKLGWVSQGRPWIFERGQIYGLPPIPALSDELWRLLFFPDQQHLLHVSPKTIDLLDAQGQILWRAQVSTYGALPQVCVSLTGQRIWVAQESPRTQLIALDMQGQPLLRAAVAAHDPLLLPSLDESVICGGRGQLKVQRLSDEGFVLGELELMEPLCALSDLGSGYIAALSLSHIQLIEASSMRSVHLQSLPDRFALSLFHQGGAFFLNTSGDHTTIERHDLPLSIPRETT